jgi:predicted CoA-binding protein
MDTLELDEGTGPVPLLTVDERVDLLRRARRIAVVGASPKAARPSNDVMGYLLRAGYDCVPVNPRAREVLGRAAYATLEDAVAATGPFDVVDVFRRAEDTPDVARSAVATGAGALWLQLGIVNWEAAQIAHDGGLAVVMDACTKIEHRLSG